jgi:hypothetical protein
MTQSFSELKLKVYFHGTFVSKLPRIKKNGFKAKYGRAVLTTNLLYSAYYSSPITRGKMNKPDFNAIIRDGIALVFIDKKGIVKIAKDTQAKFYFKEKVVKGWPNRWKTEQQGFFPKKKGASFKIPFFKFAFSLHFNKEIISLLQKLTKLVNTGELTKKDVDKFVNAFNEQLSKKGVVDGVPSHIRVVAKSIVLGCIRNTIKRKIRESILGILVSDGWKINNKNRHKVKFLNREGSLYAVKALAKIMGASFIDKDIKAEFKRVFGRKGNTFSSKEISTK